MSTSYLDILKQYWGYDAFRGIQKEIIESVAGGKDTLGLMPTGGGKSITFQVPTLAMEGICIVITPLIALMKDQVSNLKDKGIKAAGIYSGMSQTEIQVTLDNCIFGGYKFLYVSPERLTSELFCNKLKKMSVCLIAVDESHCISQWGYDFRPAYLEIAAIRELAPHAPILALTATATPSVVNDIQEKLHFKEKHVFRMSFERKNLAYIVHETDDKEGLTLKTLQAISGSAIVYARSRKRTREMANFLNRNGVTATYYHAGLNHLTKDQRQAEWKSGQVRVMVATNAFGMGIDKPDVRLVMHIDLPDSIEAYFQEAGRAGRDGELARAILFYSPSDQAKLKKRIQDSFPEKEYIRTVYEHIQYYYQMAMGDGQDCIYDFNLEEFCVRFKHFPIRAHHALNLLTQAGYLEYTEEQENTSRLIFLARRDELYQLSKMGADAEHLLQLILRSYTGLFTDYAYINEQSLAIRSGLTRERVYELLVFFAKRKIIDYIPRKKNPFIIYTQARLPKEKIKLSKEVYEDRKQSYIKRIEAILDYVTDHTHCRSKQLLRYFGEKLETSCGLCDICGKKQKKQLSEKEVESITTKILLLLENGPFTITAICEHLQLDSNATTTVLRVLADEGLINHSNGTVNKI